MVDQVFDDVREAFRRVRRHPRTTGLVVATLALGIGAASAVLSMAYTVLYADPPFREPDRLVALEGHSRGSVTGVSHADLLDYRSAGGVFEAAAISDYAEFSWTGQSLPGFEGAEVLRGLAVTPEFFRVFDHPMAIGRGFSPDEDGWSRRAVVVSHAFWQRRLEGRRDVIGQSLTLDGVPHPIVGVAGPNLISYESHDVAAWVPRPPSTSRNARQYSAYARLAPHATMAQAQHAVDVVDARLAGQAAEGRRDYAVTVAPLLSDVRREARPSLVALTGAVVCLLLIAAANAAGVLLARATVDVREMAIRAAVGASQGRLLRMLVCESALVAGLAGGAGALLGLWLLAAARAMLPPSLHLQWMFAVSGGVTLGAVMACSVVGLAAGLVPAFERFRTAAGGMRTSRRGGRLLRGIVAAEVGLAAFLSVGAGLMGKSFLAMTNRPLGYQTERLLGMRVRLEGPRYDSTEQKSAYWSELLARVSALPGVEKTATVSDLPMGWQYFGGGFAIEGKPTPTGERPPRAHLLAASPSYFGTLGIPVLAGRSFTDDDRTGRELVVMVNDVLARRHWAGRSPIGAMIRFGSGSWRRIVGVVGAVRHAGPQGELENEIYMPTGQLARGTMFLVVRAHQAPASLVPSIRQVMAAIDPDVPAFEIRTLDQAFAREIARPRFPAALTTAFAAAAMALAGLGLFGVIGYWVSRRTRELGIRSALGARPSTLRALVLNEGGRLAALGLASGLLASVAAMRAIRSLLHGMDERDLGVYLLSVVVTIAVTALACWVPAARASRTDPSTILRID